jgi:hypothetical protein
MWRQRALQRKTRLAVANDASELEAFARVAVVEDEWCRHRASRLLRRRLQFEQHHQWFAIVFPETDARWHTRNGHDLGLKIALVKRGPPDPVGNALATRAPGIAFEVGQLV